jgi:hypothetical protein
MTAPVSQSERAPGPVCPSCEEERSLRAFLSEVERLPVHPVTDAVRNSVIEAGRRLRVLHPDDRTGTHEANEAFLRAVDGLVQRAQSEGVVERLSALESARREAADRSTREDELGAVARLQWEEGA